MDLNLEELKTSGIKVNYYNICQKRIYRKKNLLKLKKTYFPKYLKQQLLKNLWA